MAFVMTDRLKLKNYKVALLCLFILFSCKDNYEHWFTKKVSEDYYLEVFSVSYGFYGGESKKYYLTDSLGFRTYIGEADENQYWKKISIENNEAIFSKIDKKTDSKIRTINIKIK